MSVGVRVETNLPEFQRWIDGARRRQIPFAVALALTRVAKLAREDIVEGLPSRFVVRGKKLGQSIRHKPASKSDWPHVRSSVYTLAEALVLQEEGGTKRPRGKSLAVPGEGVRPTPSDKITASKRPKAILKRRGSFLATLKTGANAGADAILQRVGRGRHPLRVAYLLRPSGEVRPRLEFVRTVRRRVETSLALEYHRAMEQAFASRRR